jgi:hypothetical protein
MNAWSSRRWELAATASDWRCAADRNAGAPTSGTQIWIGRRPCLRSLSRCSRTFTREGFALEGFARDDLGFDADAMTNSLIGYM